MNVGDARATDRPASRDFGHLRRLGRYLKPYLWRILGAIVALTVAAVPTGMNAGVSTMPRRKLNRPQRAAPSDCNRTNFMPGY